MKNKFNGHAVTAVIVLIGLLMSVFGTYFAFEKRMDEKIKLYIAPLQTDITWMKKEMEDFNESQH